MLFNHQDFDIRDRWFVDLRTNLTREEFSTVAQVPAHHSSVIKLQKRPTVISSKPANGSSRCGTQLFYPAASCGGKSVLVPQLRGPHLSTCPIPSPLSINSLASCP